LINDLDLALAMHSRMKVRELVVTEKVLLEVLQELSGSGYGRACLNMRQSGSSYRFLHKVYWRGLTFIHLSNEEIGDRHNVV